MIPGIGAGLGILSALQSGDASAAIPILNEAEDLGHTPEQESDLMNQAHINEGLVTEDGLPTNKFQRLLKGLKRD
jgi:hypothetical protein